MSFHRKFFCGAYVFTVPVEVYKPAEDTLLLADNLLVEENDRVLDMGTGCGVLAALAAEKASKVVAVDVSPCAVTCARRNFELNNLGRRVETRLGDLFGAVDPDEEFDVILFNAPYLPVEEDEGKRWIEKAWCGGTTGRTVIDKFIDEAPKHLAEEGQVLLVQSTLAGVEETLKHFCEHKLRATMIDEKKLPFETIVLIGAKRER